MGMIALDNIDAVLSGKLASLAGGGVDTVVAERQGTPAKNVPVARNEEARKSGDINGIISRIGS
jgi:hypothetical protein